MAHADAVSTEHRFRLPGGAMVVELTCPYFGAMPIAFVLAEPNEATPERTRLRDQVQLINALRQIGKARYLELIVEADKACHDLLLPALTLMKVGKPAEAAA